MHENRTQMFAMPIVVLFVAVVSSVAQTTEPASVLPYLNSSLPTNERVDDLVARIPRQPIRNRRHAGARPARQRNLFGLAAD